MSVYHSTLRAVKSKKFIPSPEATGNSGGNYEQHVGAACLSILLIGGIAPFRADAVLTWVELQARHRGFQTDDVLLIAENFSGAKHRIAIQAKRTFSLAASDEECGKTLRAAWDDFVSPELSITNDDRLVLITGQAPTSFTKGMRTLLDMARATPSAEDFLRRRALHGYSSKDARGCYGTVAKVLRIVSVHGVAPTRWLLPWSGKKARARREAWNLSFGLFCAHRRRWDP